MRYMIVTSTKYTHGNLKYKNITCGALIPETGKLVKIISKDWWLQSRDVAKCIFWVFTFWEFSIEFN